MTTKPSRLAREIAEMAGAQRRLGIMDEATYENIRASRHESDESVRLLRTYGDQAASMDVSRRSGLRSRFFVGVQM